MSNNKDHQSKASEQTTKTPRLVKPYSLQTHVQKLTEGWERLQSEAALAKAHQAAAQAKIQKLEAQLQESERLRVLSEDKNRALEAQSAARIQELQEANTASEKKAQELKMQLKESEDLRIQAEAQVQDLQRILEAQKVQAQVQALQRELKSRDSELKRFKAQVQGKLEELETFKSKALAAEQARAEHVLACERASHAKQLSNMEAHYLAQRNDFHAKWEARYYKDIDAFRVKLAVVQAQAQAQTMEPKSQSLGPEVKLEISTMQAEIIRLNQLAESQETQFTAIKKMHQATTDKLHRRLRAKENYIVSLHGALENEQEKLQILEHQRQQEIKTQMELRDKAVLQVEIQLEKSREEVRELRDTTLRHLQAQLEKSRAETRQVWDIVREMEGKLGEAEARLTQAQAPKRRGQPPKEGNQAVAKNVKKN